MTTRNVFRLLALPVFLVFGSAQAALVGGFNVNAYATTLDAVSPPLAATEVILTGGTLALVSTDQSVDTFVRLPGTATNSSIVLTLGFDSGTLVNGIGDDLVLFEIGAPDPFALTINNVTSTVVTLDTGFTIVGGAQLNAVMVDLSAFGITDGAAVSSIGVGLAKGGASFALAGAISAVPVPAALWLFGSGLLGLAGAVRRKS